MYVYLVWECFAYEERTLLKVCSTCEIAEEKIEKQKKEKVGKCVHMPKYHIDRVEIDIDL